MAGSRKRVLLLSGWSDGPLDVLRYAFPDVDFEKLDIPTPPAGTRWLYNRYVFFLVCFCVMCSVSLIQNTFSYTDWPHPGLIVLGLLGAIFFIRLLVYNIVRQSIRDSMSTTLKALESERPVSAIVGFSWGGGVLWSMLCEHSTSVKLRRVPSLLLAPTIQANAKCSGQRHLQHQKSASDFSSVFIICGTNDPFCPSAQEDIVSRQSQGKANFFNVDDDHVLLSPESRRLYCGILQTMLQADG